MKRPLVSSFSGGRSSAEMTHDLKQIHGDDLIVLFCNTGRERDETLDFANECDQRWGLNMVWLEYIPEKPGYKIVNYETAHRRSDKSKPSPFELLIQKKKYLPNIMARFCTQELKVRAMRWYMIRGLGIKRWDVAMGIRFDEPLRWGRYIQNTQKEPWFYVLPLYEQKKTKANVREFWNAQPFDLQLNDDEGNCDLCFLKGRAKKIRLLRNDPEAGIWWIEMEQKTGSRFRKECTYEELLQIARTQQVMFEEDGEEYPCHCTID